VYQRNEADQNSGKGETKDLREAEEQIRKSRGEDAGAGGADPKKSGNKPRFDRDR
jgi:hypothetical protein